MLAPNENGFDVGLAVRNGEYTVSWNGWHDDFERPEEALEWFTRGLAEEFRPRTEYRGKRAWRWIIEQKHENAWQPVRETGALIFPFWLKRRIEDRAEWYTQTLRLACGALCAQRTETSNGLASGY